MVITTSQSEIQKYFESSSLSQSKLKKLLDGLDNFLFNQEDEKKLYYEEKGSLIIGSAVDCILTGQKEDFDKIYHVSNVQNKPSDTIKSILNRVFDLVCEEYKNIDGIFLDNVKEEISKISIQDCTGYILQAANEHEYSKNWKDDTRINKVAENYEYFNDLKESFGKQVISLDEKSTIDLIVNSLRTNPRTSKYFNRDSQDKNQNIDFYYQLPIYFNYKGVDCKALLDLLIIFKDSEENIIKIEPIDLKTFYGKTIDFMSAVHKRRYDIQAAWYTEAIKSLYPNFQIEPFKFIVESTGKQGNPLIFKCSESLLKIGKEGRNEIKLIDTNFFSNNQEEDIIIRKAILGFDNLIDSYLFYQEQGFKEEKVIEENKGVIEINWDWYNK